MLTDTNQNSSYFYIQFVSAAAHQVWLLWQVKLHLFIRLLRIINYKCPLPMHKMYSKYILIIKLNDCMHYYYYYNMFYY